MIPGARPALIAYLAHCIRQRQRAERLYRLRLAREQAAKEQISRFDSDMAEDAAYEAQRRRDVLLAQRVAELERSQQERAARREALLARKGAAE